MGKKLFALFLIFMLAAGLAACQNQKGKSSKEKDSEIFSMDTSKNESGTSEEETFTGEPKESELEEHSTDNFSSENYAPYDGAYPYHEPYGTGIGAMPGRVIWSYNPDSVDWDGSGYWWETGHFDEAVLLQMVNESIACLAGKQSAKEGWNTLFTANKESRGINGGYKYGKKFQMAADAL